MMFHLIYVSHAIQPFSEEELIELLKAAREKNKHYGITGMLLYLNEKFIQVLEGEKEKVNAVMDKIEADPRHHKISILMEGNTRERIFHNWSMGFKRLQHHDLKSFRALRM
jgi:Sensors of blue-light using FAD.